MQVDVADKPAALGLKERAQRALRENRRKHGDLVVVTRGAQTGIALVVRRQGQVVGLPLDDCFTATVNPCSRIGDGMFDAGRQEYLEVNYGVDFTDPLPVGIPGWFPPVGSTRYEIYNAEIAHQNALETILNELGKAESSRPACQAPSTGADNPRRRVITVAGIDCGTHQDELKGGSGTIPVKSFIEMFLVRPSESDGTGANAVIWGEVIRNVSSGPGGMGAGGILNDMIQLYE